MQTRQPADRNSASTLISFSWFLVIFCFQNSGRVLGHLKRWQLCRCQKQPCINIVALYFFRTTSGFPGSFLSCSLYRNPRRCNWRLISNSGLVFFPRIPDIILLRVFESTTSVMKIMKPVLYPYFLHHAISECEEPLSSPLLS